MQHRASFLCPHASANDPPRWHDRDGAPCPNPSAAVLNPQTQTRSRLTARSVDELVILLFVRASVNDLLLRRWAIGPAGGRSAGTATRTTRTTGATRPASRTKFVHAELSVIVLVECSERGGSVVDLLGIDHAIVIGVERGDDWQHHGRTTSGSLAWTAGSTGCARSSRAAGAGSVLGKNYQSRHQRERQRQSK